MDIVKTFKEIMKFWKYLKPYLNLQIYILLIVAITTVLDLLNPLINKYVIDEFFIGRNKDALFYAIVLQAILFIFFSIFGLAKNYLLAYIGNFISMNMRKKAFEKIVNIKPEEIKNINIGEIYVTFDKDIYAIEQTLTKTIFGLLFIIFNFVVSAVIMSLLSWKYFLAIFVAIPLFLINNNFWINRLMNRSRDIRDSVTNMFSFISEIFGNIKNIRVLSKEKYTERLFIEKNRDMINKIFNSMGLQWVSGLIGDTLGQIDTIFLLIVGGYLIYTGEISFGTYIALTTYAGKCRGSFMQIVNFNVNMSGTLISVEKVENILNLPVDEKKGRKTKKIEGDIQFENVSFSYNQDKQILYEFSLEIKNGEKVAIVGESGSGKSTIINLILGLYNPTAGKIKIDGHDVGELNKESYRKRIGIVTQDSFFFKNTIKNNLLLGEKKKEAEIKRVCEIAQIDSYISSNQEKMETQLEISGSNLSGGQKQRLSIARMLLRKPDIVILDEATSALDNITEAKIQNSLKTELRDKTVITIAHRLSTIEDYDRIIVLREGKIIEEGNHERLLAKKGYYFNLVNRNDNDEENKA